MRLPTNLEIVLIANHVAVGRRVDVAGQLAGVSSDRLRQWLDLGREPQPNQKCYELAQAVNAAGKQHTDMSLKQLRNNTMEM